MAGRLRKKFSSEQLRTVDRAVSDSEDIISDHFHLTLSSWKKYRYDVRTLKDLRPEETAPEVFAQIVRYGRPVPPDGMREGDFYLICVQDHNILAAMRRDPSLGLYPLLVYVFTHELVHIVRFYKFFQFFEANKHETEAEETRVHQITYDMLKEIKINDITVVLDFYQRHRQLVI